MHQKAFKLSNPERKFLRSLPTKWRLKLTLIEESKDLSTLTLDGLISNLKVYEVVLEKDLAISKNKKEKYKLLALKEKKVSSDEEVLCSGSDDKEYAMAVRDFKKFFRRKGKFIRQPHNDKKNFQRANEEKKGKEDESEEEDDSKKDEICLMTLNNNEVLLKVKLEPDEWIKDSGCSRHMTGNKDLFSTYEAINREDSKPIKTPMSSETKLTRDEDEESVDNTKYCGMIGSLLYLMANRPDIMFSVCLCARFQEDPKTSHLEAVKRIFRYIKGTTYLGLGYPKGTGVETIIYVDFNHERDYVDSKSKSDACTFIGCYLTSWFSKKQTALSIFTIEAEYVSARKACQQDL
uniref:Uncharacterized mitochondrial protein AtMg00810-like n=1 Tax=Tanacetum cinerariifolium TaxID=118510 RepID=A0A699H4T9_TANCI|nr:uncharacterized mitochondrial protein AtMg00810-like [Tanacetum cinerariifolium]